MKTKKGFTLLELLLVIAIIASLAGIILMALNPAQRLEEANETKYLANARDLKKAIEAYAIENGGNLPSTFNSLSYGYYDICKEGESTGCINLDELIPNYLPSIPVDRNNETSSTTGFKVKYEPENQSISIYTYDEYRSWAEPNGETLTEGLVGYWKMDESLWNGTAGEVVDSSGLGNHATRAGDATTVVGKYGNGGTFDGAGDYVNVGDPATEILDFGTGDFTLSAWYYIPSLPSTYSSIISKGGSGSVGYALQICPSNKLCADIQGNGGTNQHSVGISTVATGRWQHATVVFKRDTNIYIYLDGILDATHLYEDGNTNSVSSTNNFTIGIYKNLSGFPFNGQIDEVRIYNRALSAVEVNSLYTFGAPPVAHWRFDEGTGNLAADSSGNSYDGILNNGVTWDKGIHGNALSYDGVDDYVSVGSWNNLAFPASGTIELWFKIGNAGWSNYNALISDSTIGNTINVFFMGRNGAAADPTCMRVDFGNAAGLYTNHCTTKTFALNSDWNHLALIWDTATNNVTSYVNGAFDKSIATVTTWPTVFPSMQIAKDRSYTNRYFGGSIDDMRIYNYARTPEQIVKDMNNQ